MFDLQVQKVYIVYRKDWSCEVKSYTRILDLIVGFEFEIMYLIHDILYNIQRLQKWLLEVYIKKKKYCPIYHILEQNYMYSLKIYRNVTIYSTVKIIILQEATSWHQSMTPHHKINHARYDGIRVQIVWMITTPAPLFQSKL